LKFNSSKSLASRVDVFILTQEKTISAHTSPVYIQFQARGVFEVDTAQSLLKQVEEGHAAVKSRGQFSSPAALKDLLTRYDEAAKDLRDRINKR
jgi:hypothetical protein